MKTNKITITVNHKKLGTFDVVADVNVPTSVDEFVQQAENTENALNFIESGQARTLKARANSVWRSIDPNKDLPENVTKDSVSADIVKALQGNAFVALRGTGETAKGKEAIATVDAIRALKQKLDASEISVEEYMNQMSALI